MTDAQFEPRTPSTDVRSVATALSPATTLTPPTRRDRLSVMALLVATAVLYLWNITVNGSANSFYAGAAWAGSQNWEALLFGSVDPSNFITVDKPPVSQWIMGLSGQIFGYSSASMLIPEALMGVASVALMYAAVTRVGGRTAGLIAGAALALTPVAALMFRFNNPDAAMVLLMTAAAYATIRATATASLRWLSLAGVAVGLAFLAKMLEGVMVLPALGLVYLVAAPTVVSKRIWHLVVATVVMVASAGWYVVLTLLWPASSRPYLAGSTDNNFMNLVLGYNGLARIEGRSGSGGRGNGMPSMADAQRLIDEVQRQNPRALRGGGGGMFGNAPGITRLFTGEFGIEISFLLPAALVALVVVLVLRGRAPRTDTVRAGALLFGVWMLLDVLVLSYMNGTAHPYYSLAIAPPIAGLIGLGARETWRAGQTVGRERVVGRIGFSGIVLAATVWGFVLLDRIPAWQSWIKWVVLIGGIAVVAVVFTAIRSRADESAASKGGVGRRVAITAAAVAALCGLGAPAAYAIDVDASAHTGGSPSVTPAHAGTTHSPSRGGAGGRFGGGAGGGFGGGGFGGATASPALDTLLRQNHDRWAAAVDRSSTAASLELSARVPVMAIGGFSNDPAPSLAQFQKYVTDKQIGYYLVSSTGFGRSGTTRSSGGSGITGSAAADLMRMFGGSRAGSVNAQIEQWVADNFSATTVGGYQVYDLGKAPTPQPKTSTPTGGTTASGEKKTTAQGATTTRSRHRRTA
nr:glycosyltransferase family 39 protein [Williamsia sterculiae]